MKEDWIECVIEDVAQILNGDRGKNYPSRSHYLEKGMPFISAGNIGKHSKLKNELNFISEERFELLKAGKLQKGDIVYCIRGSIGKFAVIDFHKGAIASSLCIIRINETIECSLLCYYLDSHLCKLEIHNFDNGTAQPNLSAKDFKKFKLPLPPLVEQKAIVKKIEELFSSLDSGIADLKKAQDQLVIYRQAVLKKAFEGEFKKVKLEDACEKATKVKRKEMDINEPLLYLDIGGIDNKTNIIFSHKEYTWENAPSRAQQIVKVGDVLFSTVRTYLKNIAQVNNLIYNDEIASSGFTIIRGKKDLLNTKFIFFIATSQFFLEPLNKLQRGTSYPAVRDKDVFSQLIPLPTLEEQHQIVQEIESRLSVCDTVEKDITDSLEKAQSLRQSILKKAFEGKLLNEEEVAKCKTDAAYEPASVLLEKIKAEKMKK